MAQRRLSQPEAGDPPLRPRLADQPSRFVLLEREVELEYRPQMLEALQRKVDTVAEEARVIVPECPQCGQPMSYHGARPVSWLAHWGRLQASPARYRCSACQQERRPLLDLLGVEPGRICGSLARLLGLLAVVAPYELAARLARLLLGVTISAMGVWRVAQRLGQAAANYSEALSQYHADSRSEGASVAQAPSAVILGVDGCTLGMQVRTHRRRRVGTEPLPALPVIEQGHFREVKTGVLLLPSERVETTPGRRSVVRRFLVTCLGEADEIFRRLYAQLREMGWVGSHTVVVIVGDGAEWIWNLADPYFPGAVQIVDLYHARQHLWELARRLYPNQEANQKAWIKIHQKRLLDKGKIEKLVTALRSIQSTNSEVAEKIRTEADYFERNAERMHYPTFRRQHLFVGSGVIEAGCKTVIGSRLKRSGMFWTVRGANAILALRCCHLNGRFEDYWEARRAA